MTRLSRNIIPCSAFHLFYQSLIFFASHVNADLRITFSPDALDSCASPVNATEHGGVTFTTGDTPPQGPYSACFNLQQLFTSNSSTGNASQSAAYRNDPPYDWTYLIENQAAFNGEMNYSRIWYEQTDQLPPASNAGTALRYLVVYSGPDCTDLSEEGAVPRQDLPYYSWSCLSQGQCREAAIKIMSFRIMNAADVKDPNRGGGGCEDFALRAAAPATNAGYGVVFLAIAWIITWCWA